MAALELQQNGQGEPGQNNPETDERLLPIAICPTGFGSIRVKRLRLALELLELPYLIVPLFENFLALALRQRMNSPEVALD